MAKIKIFGLGGLNENGKNMYVVEVDKSIFIFDAGLRYDYDLNLGIDYIIPDLSYLEKNKKNIKGIFITHGHESSMGAVADIVSKIPSIPIYGTKLTLDIIKNDLKEEELSYAKLIEIKPHVKINFGKNSIFPIRVTHSIPDAVLFVLYTVDGAIVYTGDFVFDSTMLGPYKTDMGKLAYVGKQGVLCLLSESSYASRPGHTTPNNRVSGFIRDILNKNEGRIITTVFPAHFYRIQEIFNEVSKTHRKIVIMGKQLQNLINKASDENYLQIDKSRIGTLANINDKDVVILISDEKEKPFNNIKRIVKGYDKFIKMKDTDTVFISEPPYPGIELDNVLLMDDIAMMGANAVSLSAKKHLLHHASSEDLMLMIDLMQPKYYFPVKSEYRNLVANADIASGLGMPKENIILKLNGEVVEFVDGVKQDTYEKVPVGEILIDGSSQDNVGELVLKDREMLGSNGIVIVSATLDRASKNIIGGPEIITRGFIYVKESQELLEETKVLAASAISDSVTQGERLDFTKIKNNIREVLGNFFYQSTGAKPMIITVVQEI